MKTAAAQWEVTDDGPEEFQKAAEMGHEEAKSKL